MIRRARLLLTAGLSIAMASLTALPADAAVPTVIQRSSGSAFVEAYDGWGSYFYVRLTGTISFGSRTFTGAVTGGGALDTFGEVWDLNASPGSLQQLHARCRLDDGASAYFLGIPLVELLVCTGHVDDGPLRTTVLSLVLPDVATFDPYHGGQFAYRWNGTYEG
ncbi:MAG: hypothetical protein M3P04_00985 [Actinomycetota bacterium]|nr:hypothetical protein [Actinomycetota bacterium]